MTATAALRLYASGMNEQLVMERRGHTSTEEVRSYEHTLMQKFFFSNNLSMVKKIKHNTITIPKSKINNSAVANVYCSFNYSTKCDAFN